MRTTRLLAFALTAFAAVSAHAESADIRVVIQGSFPPALATRNVMRQLVVTNDGPSTAANILLSASGPGAQSTVVSNRRCPADSCSDSIGLLDPGQSRLVTVSFDFANAEARTLRMTFTVMSETPDPNSANNTSTQDDIAVVTTRLSTSVDVEQPVEPGLPANVSLQVYNGGLSPAAETTLELQLDNSGELLALTPPPGVACTSTKTTARCELGTLTADVVVRVGARVLMPALYDGGTFVINAIAHTTSPTIDEQMASARKQIEFFPLFIVSTAADDGPGSLREAITDANARCAAICRIGFRIPQSELVNDIATIHVGKPLPFITATVPIDGTSEKTFLQLKDVTHPIISLDGARVAEGDGLTFAAASNAIADVAIGNFPQTAITLVPRPGNSSIDVRNCYIGTDATGLVSMPNERGVIAPGNATLAFNLISGNRRSGVWLQGGQGSSVRNSLIGVASDGSPLPNGASGIYLGPGIVAPRIEGNTIANNGEFGIAVHPSVQRVAAAHNTIRDNALFGIDYGLDLATPNVTIDIGRAPNKPVLFSARYDAAKQKTIVDGDLLSQPDRSNRFSVVFYSNRSDVNAQAEQEAGEVVVNGAGHFTAELPGDLRGRSITAVTVRAFRLVPDEGFAITEDTSEISAPIPVTQ